MNDFAAVARSLMPAVRALATDAGAVALHYFQLGGRTAARSWAKGGGSPVTEADIAVDRLLKARLLELLPEAGWLSEETTDDPARLMRQLVWIVDPIDGTRSFAAGHRDWSIAIALLADDRPTLGIVYAPAHDLLYEAVRGDGARQNGAPITVSNASQIRGARAAGPKPLVDQLERAAGPIQRLEKIPSLALRIARVAEGAVDLGLVSGNACDWDIAAADLILAEAGGRLTAFDAGPPAYNRPEPLHGELAAASRQLHPQLIEAMTAR